jgi:uncharacterized protein
VLSGPRQVGKTTIIKQLIPKIDMPAHYASADQPTIKDITWLEQQWEIARLNPHHNDKNQTALLVLDEIQKIPHWSDVVKKLWDEDEFNNLPLKVILLGSSPLLLQQGLTESLAGRFEIIPVTHWSYPEMRDAFGWDLNQYIYYGGYPKSAGLIDDETRWINYINDSLIETTISRDILLMTRVNKPALLRQLFHLGCSYSGQILSYQKMLGQLSDAGNATTLAHYLTLLTGAGMLAGIEKYAAGEVHKKSSSPKLIALNTALMTAQNGLTFKEALKDRDYWGRLVETAVGAHLLNSATQQQFKVYYWREHNKEVDFVLAKKKNVVAIEVKSGMKKTTLPGMTAFKNKFKPKRILLVGGEGIPLEEFFTNPVEKWLSE